MRPNYYTGGYILGLDGIKEQTKEKVDLSEFFMDDRWVEIRILPPIIKAKISEIGMEGLKFTPAPETEIGYVAVPVTEGTADRSMKIRDIKLREGVVDHNISSDGEKSKWGHPLWRDLDDWNPKVLEKVVLRINDLNKLVIGADPT